MQCYTELTPPTSVTHAINLPFLAPKANNLIVAKASLLQIFELKSTITEVISASNDDSQVSPILETETVDIPLQRTEHTSRLVLVGEYPLSGTVTSIARIKLLDTKSGAEALLIAFRDAKLSLVEWDSELHSLNTISIHYYEGQNLSGAPWSPDLDNCYNFLTADPSSRCAALKFGARNLAILPFRQVGDDLVEGEYEPDLDDAMDMPSAISKASNGSVNKAKNQTPYTSSFVLPLTALDPALTNPVHLAFLHEYREPTFGIISSSKAPAASLLNERKDLLTYTVFTLDLEQKASTTLLSVSGIPYDVSKVVPLPLPVGGALLMGGNEIIHVDQAGKTNAVAVNEFARTCTSFPMADQSDLSLRLEGCIVEQLSADTGDVLIVLNNGDLMILNFIMDGRSVSGMALQRVSEERGGRSIKCGASCAANLGRGRIFVGSEDGESVLLGWTSNMAQLSRKRSHVDLLADDGELSFDEEDLEDLDDDLYDNSNSPVKQSAVSPSGTSAPRSYHFRVHDMLASLALIKDVALGASAASVPSKKSEPNEALTQISATMELVASTGKGAAGGVTILKSEIDPRILKQANISSARSLWSVHAKKPVPKGLVPSGAEDSEANIAADAEDDQYLIVCKAGQNGNEDTVVYQINGTDIEETPAGEFEREDASTMDVGILASGTRIVQVLRSEIRIYDSDLGLAQIIPMEDEETGAELRITNTSFADPYLLVLRDDSSVRIFQADPAGEVEEIESEGLSSTQWLSGCLYKSPAVGETPLAFLLTVEGGFRIFDFSNLDKPSYIAEGLGFLPPTLTVDYAPRRSSARATLTEILVADLGDKISKSPHLFIRTASDDLNIYQPYHYPLRDGSASFTTNLRWLKLSQMHLPKYSNEPAMDLEDAGRESTLKPLSNIGGYSTVFQRGSSPCFVLKEASSAPKVMSLRGKAVKGLTRFQTDHCERGFAYIDADDILRICQLPSNCRYGDLGWAARKICIGQEVHALDYHPKGVYVLGTGQMVDFNLPEDSYHYEWAREDTTFKPQVEQGIIKLLHTGTWSIIDSHELDPYEVILCVKTLNLEVSENTHERKPLVAVGTAIVRGEDLATKGCIYIFEVITVVPEPGRPETNRKLRLIVKEEVKGAVTAVSEVGSQGFMIMAQGQKCMVRGLKEDGTLLPVAFLDMQCYVSVLKELNNTGMLLMGDAFKGLWFTGYTEEPYKMIIFGKGRSNMEVITADFLPYGKQLHIIIADADCNLHVLQFDPEHPKSLSGQRLLHKSTFHTGHFPTTMMMLRSTLSLVETDGFDSSSPNAMEVDNAPPSNQPLHHLLLASQSGTLALLTPLSEPSYRRLSALATFLTNNLEHPCGLNPRAYRAVESEGFGSRGTVDGGMLRRWGELGSQRRSEACSKVGIEEWVLRSDLEVVAGGGLGF
ncbi:hypothetical protein K432DRAFT_381504 [Lepidopterella palustris CBS 459.81]|uniref:Protein CFT1 n=1 Tax=Lepidopterella palustris CBS 459.81 TaxID=1314670 RepID=A0A8E2ECI7_9PEZI|nr:hypothetical protein K432DRAFT_381504 [Lepidopterella palustris CBS 459.81]